MLMQPAVAWWWRCYCLWWKLFNVSMYLWSGRTCRWTYNIYAQKSWTPESCQRLSSISSLKKTRRRPVICSRLLWIIWSDEIEYRKLFKQWNTRKTSGC